jgi:ADP-L-glycero-D-manno-heptose 6-epimerase
MIVVTGGEGFIGKNLVAELRRQGNTDVAVLDIKNEDIDLLNFWLLTHGHEIDCVFHLGAITDTTVMDRNLFDDYNVASSIFVWNLCTNYKIPLIYASSAATYGDGSMGFDDESDIINLQPLNPYGWSKQQFDVWAEMEERHPPFWYGLKFFNVYGFGEAHKGKMASMVFHMFNQIDESKKVKLFKSHNPKYSDGGQFRDFIYIDDIVDVCIYLSKNKPESGIYNVGTGKARTFNDLAMAVFMALGHKPNITYIDTPLNIRDQYQYFTQAKMDKLRRIGYSKPFHEIEEGVFKYINKLKE